MERRGISHRQRCVMGVLRCLVGLMCVVTVVATGGRALAYDGPDGDGESSLGVNEGEIDIRANFTTLTGQFYPTDRPTTWQDADTLSFEFGAGYTLGAVGPLTRFRMRVDGGYYIAGDETIDNPVDELFGRRLFDADKAGYVRATVSANLVEEPRYALGTFIQGTIPLDVNLAKFSSRHLHFGAAGLNFGVYLGEPQNLARLSFSTRLFFGSGAYGEEGQHNASASMNQLLAVEFRRWLLPWRMGVAVGPMFEGDLNSQINETYRDAYAPLSPDLTVGEEVQRMRLSLAVYPYFQVTDHAALELGFVQTLVGVDVQSTQAWTGSVRVAF